MNNKALSAQPHTLSDTQLEKAADLFEEAQLNFKPLVYQGEYSSDPSGQLDPNQIPHSAKWFYVQKLAEDKNVNRNKRKIIYWTSPNFLGRDLRYAKTAATLKSTLFAMGYEVYIGKTNPVRVNNVKELDAQIALLEPTTRVDVANNLSQTDSLATVDRTCIFDLITEYNLVRRFGREIIREFTGVTFLELLTGVSLDVLEDFLPVINYGHDKLTLEIRENFDLEQIRLLVSGLQYIKNIDIGHSVGSQQIEEVLVVLDQVISDTDDLHPKQLNLRFLHVDLTSKAIQTLRNNKNLGFVELRNVECYDTMVIDDQYSKATRIRVNLRACMPSVDSGFSAPSLRSLSLSNANMELQHFNTLLSRSPKLQYINLERIHLFELNGGATQKRLPTRVTHTGVTVLTYSQPIHWLFEIISLINTFPALEVLGVIGYDQQDEVQVTPKLKEFVQQLKSAVSSNNKVRSLSLKNFTIDEQNFAQILSCFENLESIQIDNCRFVVSDRAMQVTYPSLDRLAKLYINGDELPEHVLEGILNSANQIQEIVLAIFLFNYDPTRTITLKSLDKLGSIRIRSDYGKLMMSIQWIEKLWQSAKNLNSLDLNGVKCTGDASQCRFDQRLKLKRLHGEWGTKSLHEAFIRSAPNLEYLNTQSDGTKLWLALKDMCLSKLEQVDVLDMLLEELVLLPKIAPNLRRLNPIYLSDTTRVKNQGQYFTGFSQLEKLSISGSWSRQHYFKQFSAQPSLRHLTIREVSLSKKALLDILQHPFLESLSIIRIKVSHKKDQLLDIINSAQCFTLENLHLTVDQSFSFTVDHVKACLKKFHRLKSFSIDSNEFTEQDKSSLKLFIEQTYPDIKFDITVSVRSKRRLQFKDKKKVHTGILQKSEKLEIEQPESGQTAQDEQQEMPTIDRDAVVQVLQTISHDLADKIDLKAILGKKDVIASDEFMNNALHYIANMSEHDYQRLITGINLDAVSEQLEGMVEDMIVGTVDEVNEHVADFIKLLLPEFLSVIRESLLLENGDVKSKLQSLQNILASCSTPKNIQKQIGVILTKVAKIIAIGLPKLFKHVQENKPLATEKDWLKIVSLPKLIGLGISAKSFLNMVDKDPFFDQPIQTNGSTNIAQTGLIVDLEDFNFEQQLQEVLHKSSNDVDYNFNTWETLNTAHCQNFSGFWSTLSDALESRQAHTPNALVYMDKKDMGWFNIAVLNQQLTLGRQHYYIDNIERAHLTTLASNKGLMVEAKTRLAIFLEQAGPGDVLVVEASERPQDVLGLTDPQGRQFLTKVVPNGVKIIVQYDASAPPIKDPSIYSRFSVQTTCDVPLLKKVPMVSYEKPATNNHLKKNVYHDVRGWRTRLVGQFRLQGRAVQFIEQAILQAIVNKQNTLEIVNYPKDCSEFLTWAYTIATTREIWVNNVAYPLHKDFTIHLTEQKHNLEYDRCQFVEFDKMQHGDFDYALSPATIFQFLENHLEKNQKLFQTDGWLKAATKPLTILVDAKLNRDQWAEIIDECRKYNVSATFCVLDKALCPAEYQAQMTKAVVPATDLPLPKKFGQTEYARVDVLVSQNHNATINALCQSMKIDGVYDLLHADNYSDLIDYLDCQQFGIDYQVEHKSAFIWEQLQSTPAKTIILKGPVSATIKAKLATLFGANPRCWVNGQAQSLVGRLILVTDEQHDIKHAQHRFVDAQPVPVIKPPMVINVQGINDINDERFRAATSVYAHSPWLKVIGEFGVGKSIFARKIFKALAKKELGIDVQIFIGKDELDAYGAYNKGHKLIILDEYNLEPDHTWDTFSGMTNPITPGFRNKHNFYATQPRTQKGFEAMVMFLGNPNSKQYEGRHHHQFVDEMIPGLLFNQFTHGFLQDNVMRPIFDAAFAGNPQPEVMKEYTQPLIASYEKIKALAANNKAISARNLAMLTCRFVCYLDECTPLEALANAVLEEAVYLLEDDKAIDDLFEYLAGHYPITKPDHTNSQELDSIINKMGDNGYIVTASRIPILKQLLAMFSMRKKIIAKLDLDKFVIRGILIEGETRVGKTAMVNSLMHVLGMHDSTEVSQNAPINVTGHEQFYTITASNEQAMKSLVARGQLQGGINLIDEINTKPNESVLNAPLTGVDQQGKPSGIGHRVIATANPASLYPGRTPLSDAMKNRFMMFYMANLPEQELRYIVRKMGAEDQTDRLVDAFLAALQYADRHNKYPLPTPALLFKTSQEVASQIAANKLVAVMPVVTTQENQLMTQAEQLVAQLQQPDDVADALPGTQNNDMQTLEAQNIGLSATQQMLTEQEKHTPHASKYDQLKAQIVEKIWTIRNNPKASLKNVLLHPIRTYRNWRKRRIDRRTLRSLKKKWMVGRIEELVVSRNSNRVKPTVELDKVSAKTAKKMTTKTILKKFRRAAFPLDKKQAGVIVDIVQSKKSMYNSKVKIDGKLIRKTAKLHLWADIERNLHAQAKQDVMLNALAGAKKELLTTIVAALKPF